MGIEENKAVIHRWAELWKWKRPTRQCGRYFQRTLVHHAGRDFDYSSFKKELDRMSSLGVRYRVGDIIAEGDRVAVWWVLEGEPTKDDPKMRNFIYRIADGKIVESINAVVQYR